MRVSGVAGCAAGKSTDMHHPVVHKAGNKLDDIKRLVPARHADVRSTAVSTIVDAIVTGFLRQQGTLTCDGVPLADLASAEGTPLYVYSAATIAERYRAIDRAFSVVSTFPPLRAQGELDDGDCAAAAALGAGADANSGGEIDVALRAGFIPSADRLHRRRQDVGRAGAGDRSRHHHHQCRVRRRDRSASTRWRRDGKPGPASRFASTRTSTRRAIPTSRPV